MGETAGGRGDMDWDADADMDRDGNRDRQGRAGLGGERVEARVVMAIWTRVDGMRCLYWDGDG